VVLKQKLSTYPLNQFIMKKLLLLFGFCLALFMLQAQSQTFV